MKKLILITFILIVTNVFATSNILGSNIISYHLKSNFNHISYNLYIYLPKNYKKTSKHYPVIYLLDADYSFLLAKQIIEHLSERKRIEQYIIVGIAYDNLHDYKKNRTRDYTPTYTLEGGYSLETQKLSGGAEKFYQFINNELKPYINNHYSVNGKNTLVGHSFGGLFGMFLLINHPQTFQNYIIVSPSLWYDREFILKQAIKKTNFNLTQPTYINFFIGEMENGGEHKMIDEVKQINQLLHRKSHKNLWSSLAVISKMDHDTVFPTALTLGIIKM